jgi:hypothetical protein
MGELGMGLKELSKVSGVAPDTLRELFHTPDANTSKGKLATSLTAVRQALRVDQAELV